MKQNDNPSVNYLTVLFTRSLSVMMKPRHTNWSKTSHLPRRLINGQANKTSP